MKKITIITGRFGCGKTNFAANLALKAAASGEKVTIIDLDIVNPYFRTADFSELFQNNGVKLIAPMYANTSLDIPAVSFDIESAATGDGYVIIDPGGDETGAGALGRFAQGLLENFSQQLDMWYVVNRFRSFDENVQQELEVIRSIEAASRMPCTGIVGNPNLGSETTAEMVLDSSGFAQKLSETSGLPLIYNTFPEQFADKMDKVESGFAVKILVKPPWEGK